MLKNARSRRYPSEIITDVVYADDVAFLANTPAQAEFRLHKLEHTVVDIGHHLIVNKSECI